MFLIDTHHGSSVESLVQGDSVIVKAGNDCRCLNRIKMDENLLVAYSSMRCHDEDVNLHGKWTGCLATVLEKSPLASLQNVFTTVNKMMADIATVARFFHISGSSEDLFMFPSLDNDSTVDATVVISLPITQ